MARFGNTASHGALARWALGWFFFSFHPSFHGKNDKNCKVFEKRSKIKFWECNYCSWKVWLLGGGYPRFEVEWTYHSDMIMCFFGKYLGSPPFISQKKAIWKGSFNNPILRGQKTITMVIYHLQVLGLGPSLFPNLPEKTSSEKRRLRPKGLRLRFSLGEQVNG